MHDMPMHFAAPPRRVPLSLRVINLCNGASLFGWAFFGFGMIFVWIFGAAADFSFLTFHGEGRTRGRVVRVEGTGASENEQRVDALHYEYSVAGRMLEGTSYVTGGGASEGQEVTVEYDESTPERSRIEGMRRALFGPWAAFVAVFPAVGLGFLVFGTRVGMVRNHLLREGILTTGSLIRREPTNVTVNKRRVWELTFEFNDRSGRRCEAAARATDTSALEDDPREPLLYDPDDPRKAFVLDEAPARPRFENGELMGRPLAALGAALVPLLFLAIHGAVAAVKLGLW